ncbi:DNA-binding transcription factor yap1 [Pestalotiopsis sp. 9143b]|nr:DNA-binding transcription factor yap1 [Pestalotiopsis sp. 9143b]
MASAHANGLPPNFILTPQQQALLFRALTSNQPNNGSPQNHGLSLSPASLAKSPAQLGANGVQESPFLDYDYSFGPDSSGFDFDLGLDQSSTMIGDLPGDTPTSEKASSSISDKGNSPENDIHDKRSHPDDGDDEEKEEGSAKRRESEGKVPKKPGRKPLTNEPSSKRKAQNRAAQRAFRERKEQHLKDLETKVEELEKASQQTNDENSQLRSQVEKMTTELNEYKKRLSLVNTSMRPAAASANPRGNAVFGSNLVNNLNDVNFQFEFPKFGILPGPAQKTAAANGRSPSFPSPSNSFSTQPTPASDKAEDKTSAGSSKSPENNESSREALAKFASIINGTPNFDGYYNNASRTSLDSTSFSVAGTNSGSPSASSNSNAGGPSSSCGTSPEPFTQSPVGFKPVDTLTTIGEEQPSHVAGTTDNHLDFGNFDVNNFDWLAQQNGGQFDPQLFGGYREPQDNILANPAFDDTFFNEAFDADFSTPFNVAPSPKAAPKKNICTEIDERKEEEDTIVTSVNGKLLTCNNIWERLQNCPKVQTGDIDLDGLCSDLQKKAKCGGTGAVVDEKDFRAVMTKHLGPCPDEANQEFKC